MLGKIAIFHGNFFEKSFFQEIPRNFPQKVIFREKNVQKIGPWSPQAFYLQNSVQQLQRPLGIGSRVLKWFEGFKIPQSSKNQKVSFMAFVFFKNVESII
jgi:hypothetical protein